MTIITVTASKGGTAKTTTATTLASGLANFQETLLIDADPIGNCALAFGRDSNSGLFHWMMEGTPLRDHLLSGRPEKLMILSGDNRTKVVERFLVETENLAILSTMISRIDYPYIVIDTASNGILQEAALRASDLIVVPFRPEPFNVDSVYSYLELIRDVAPDAQTLLLPVGVDNRLNEHRQSLTRLYESLPPDLRWTPEIVVNLRVAVMEAQAYGLSIWEYNGEGIKDVRKSYSQLVSQVMSRTGVYDEAAD
jgi:cellulose biosynthesis protein BcsQ